MIPVSLSIEGLYSYQKKQVIDFERLTQSQLFGIFGATGSGKSSILEAITLALYNECERLNRNLRNYNMMNLRSKELYVDLSFYINDRDNSMYRFVVSGKRHSKKFDQVKYERQAYHRQKGTWVPISEDTAESILGLSYENFKRTVIIPQGRFREFIELNDSARSKMLNDIFGLNRFIFFNQTKSLINKNNTEIARKEALLQKLEDITENRLAQLQSQTGEMAVLLARDQKALQGKEKIREKQERLKQWVEEIAHLEDTLQALTQQKKAFDQREQQLNAYTQCLKVFREPLNRKQELAQELKNIQEDLKTQQDMIQKLTHQLAHARQSYRDIEENFQQRHKLHEKAEEYNKVIELKSLEKYLVHLSQRKENGTQKLTEARDQKEKERVEIKELDGQMVSMKSALPDPQHLMDMREWWSRQQQLLGKKLDAEQVLTESEEEIHQAIQRKRELISDTFLDVRQYELPTTQIIQLIVKEIDRLQEESKDTDKKLQGIQVKNQLERLANNLIEGEPCPLCGATNHPHPLNISLNELELKKYQSQQESLRKQLRHLDGLVPLLRELVKQAESLGKRKKSGIQSLESSKQDLEAHRATWSFGDSVLPEEEIKAQLSTYQEMNTRLEQNETRMKALREDLEEVEQKIQTYQQTLVGIQQEYNEKWGHFQSQKASLKQVIYDKHHTSSDEDLREQALKMQNEYEQIGILYKDITQKIEDQKGRLSSHEGKRDAKHEAYRSTTQKLARLNQELDEALASYPFDSFTYINEILALNLNIDAERYAIDQYKRSLTETQTRLAGIKEQMEGKSFDLEQYERLMKEIEIMREELQRREQEIGALKLTLESEQKQWIEKQKLQKELDKLNIRAENLKMMSNLFRGDGFVKYVSSAYLENLCIAANERFMRLTHNALSLEVDENNQFHVRDRLNDGRIRSIRTLSGGQTFQAALCLALALADQVREQVQAKQNFFFLDEGFGALDKDSLRLIFQTLQTLRRENRIVGIISHVEELQQEIDTFLHIHNDPETGSKVVPSWG